MKTKLLTTLIMAAVIVSACATPAPTATPVPTTRPTAVSTSTSVPPTAVPPTSTPIPPTPTTIPATATPSPTPVLATSAKDIVGIWHGLGTDGLYQQFFEDGTIRVAVSREGLLSPDVEMTFVFEDARFVFKETKAIGLPSCGSKVGTYEVELLAQDKIRFVRISDGCTPRAHSTAQLHERVR